MNWNNEQVQKDMEALTVDLVNVRSVNGTRGEVEISERIESILREIPYFKRNSDQVWTKTVEDDSLGRKTVFALLKSESPSTKTVLLHAHSDTVTIEDFGELKELANQPGKLMEKMKEVDLPQDVKSDLESGDWLFGRGSVDMKSGIAAHLVVLKYLSENRDAFTGNILFMANPIEETTHGGIIDALSELERLQREEQLHFECAINTDFVGPKYTGDQTRYIYLGSVGKLLPAFYIRGSETHVGQAFEGLDPNLIASELVRRVDYNTDLADEAEGEVTLPPVTLKQKDLKPTYNVQTPIASYVYFNYFVHQISPEEILHQLSGIAKDAFDHVLEKMNEEYKKYSERASFQMKELPWESRVVTYSELFDKVHRKYGDTVHTRLNKVVSQYAASTDPREVGRLLVEELLLLDDDTSPVIVLFFATPYVPRNFVKNHTKREKNVLQNLHKVLADIAAKEDEKFEVNKFFPSLTDSSYLCIDDTDEDIAVLKENFPEMDSLYPVPIESIRKLNIPALNIGTWGKDAHKKTERVYKPYTFDVLPTTIKSFCKSVLS